MEARNRMEAWLRARGCSCDPIDIDDAGTVWHEDDCFRGIVATRLADVEALARRAERRAEE